MNKRTLTIAALLMMMAALVPASAYHIDGNEVATAAQSGAVMTSADWEIGTGGLILCESNGNFSSRNAGWDGGRHGVGGLCTTGENDATGEHKPTGAPAKGDYVELDTCDRTTLTRNSGAAGPYSPGTANDCGNTGNRDIHGFTAEIGVFSCSVDEDQALYYDRLYAFWSYDGNPRANGAYGASDNAGDEENGGSIPLTDVNNEDAWHGHVGVFVNATAGATGSVVTKLTGQDWPSADTNSLDPEACGSSFAGDGSPVFVAKESY